MSGWVRREEYAVRLYAVEGNLLLVCFWCAERGAPIACIDRRRCRKTRTTPLRLLSERSTLLRACPYQLYPSDMKRV